MLYFQERINPDITDIIAKISFKDFIKIYIAEQDKNGNLENTVATYRRLTEYCKTAKRENYTKNQQYSYSQGKSEGRQFLQGTGIQNIPAAFRGVLVNNIMTDFDMVCCHQRILYKLCMENQIQAPNLNAYINNRDHYLKQLSDSLKITREESKKLFIISLNSSESITTHGRTKIKLQLFLDFDQEMKRIQADFINKFPYESNELRRTNGKARQNLGGCFLNQIICNRENEILMKTIKKMIERGRKIGAPMFDGFLLYNYPDMNINELIRELNEITELDNIVWTNKPHNLDFLPLLQCIDQQSLLEFPSTFAPNIIELARILYKEFFKDRLICSLVGNKPSYFLKLESNNLWSRGELVPGLIENWLTNKNLYISTEKDTTPINDSIKWVRDCRDRIITESIENPDNDFINRIFQRSLYKLNFLNGVYDFRSMIFSEDMSIMDGYFKIPYKFENPNNEIINEIYERILNPIFGCVDGNATNTQFRDYIIYKLARAIGGFYSDKLWWDITGLRNSGKGIISLLLKKTIGEYYTTADSNNFLNKPSGGDAAKANMWLYGYELNRIIAVNEFSTDPSNKKHYINGQIIKTISGGDEIEVRPLFGMPQRLPGIQAGLMFFSNEKPPIIPENTMENAISWNMISKFYNPKKPIRQLPGYYYFPRDDNLKDWIKEKEGVGLAFMWILIKSLLNGPIDLPSEMVEEAEENETGDGEILTRYISYTANENDKVATKDIENHLSIHGVSLNQKLISSYLKNMGGIKCFIDDDGNKRRGYKCLKLI